MCVSRRNSSIFVSNGGTVWGPGIRRWSLSSALLPICMNTPAVSIPVHFIFKHVGQRKEPVDAAFYGAVTLRIKLAPGAQEPEGQTVAGDGTERLFDSHAPQYDSPAFSGP